MMKLSPLLLMNAMNPVKKKKKKATKKKAKKKAVAKKSEIKRPSPFKVGDAVWCDKGAHTLTLSTITKCIAPKAKYAGWQYQAAGFPHGYFDETGVLPASMFHLMATDATVMRTPTWCQHLNAQYDADAKIYAVWRKGRRHPWAYYVIPDINKIWKDLNINPKDYYLSQEKGYAVPIAELPKLMPIAAAPSEILSYLGNRIYNRYWRKLENGGLEFKDD